MGVASLETRGWTAPSAAAFELALREKKFSVFAVSRLGTGRKKPLDPPRREPVEPVEPVSHVTNDAAIEPPFEASVEPPSVESPDPRLAGKSFTCMVEYYYNVFLTRPDAEDDDDDRSACDEEEFAAAPELERGGAKRRGARSTSAANASTGGVPRSASERELARLGVGERAPKKKKSRSPRVDPGGGERARRRASQVHQARVRERGRRVRGAERCCGEGALDPKTRPIPRHGPGGPGGGGRRGGDARFRRRRRAARAGAGSEGDGEDDAPMARGVVWVGRRQRGWPVRPLWSPEGPERVEGANQETRRRRRRRGVLHGRRRVR